MALLFESIWFNVMAILVLILLGIASYWNWVYKYWERLGIPYLQPKIPFGTAQNIFNPTISIGELVAQQYTTAKAKGYKHIGLFSFTRPEYMPVDTEIVKNVLVKDFNYFNDRGFYLNEVDDPISGTIFFLNGEKSKNIRTSISPTFTSGKIKTMFSTIVECSRHLTTAIDLQRMKGPIDIKDFLGRFGTDVIGSCAFGLDCNSFTNTQSDFCKYAKRIIEPTDFENMKGAFTFFFPSLAKFLRLRAIPIDVSNFFLKSVRSAIEYRKENSVVRNDFLQLQMDLMNNNDGLTIEQVAAQSFGFFLAGFETSSTAVMFCLYELALNHDIQEKLRTEVNKVTKLNNHEITYEGMNDMVYMRQVLDEVMRKYPPIPILNRVCTMDYTIPNTKIILKKGTPVTISALGIQHDPEYYPAPEKFDPERFAPENKATFNHLCYLPFGEGPRICMGMRFAFLQMKVVLSALLKKYKFSVNSKTQVPLKMSPKVFVMAPIGSIWLDAEEI